MVSDDRNSEVDRACGVPVAHPVQADQLSGGRVQAGLEAGGLAEPAVEVGLGDAVAQVGGDLDQPRPDCGLQPQTRAWDAGFSELDSRSCSWPAGSDNRPATCGCCA